MGNPVIDGRSITRADFRNREKVVVIAENLAREYWDGPSRAVGKRIRIPPPDSP